MAVDQTEQDARFREVHERISDAFYAVDEAFRFTYLNEHAEDLLQADADELLGERVWDAFPEAAETEAWNAFHEALETQQPTEYELHFDPLDFWVDARVYPSETGLSVYFRDVTERKERERKLREQRERLAALNHLNEVVREINRGLVQQSTREEIESMVCESLANSDSYQFAWVGTVDESTNEVVPTTTANAQGYVDAITITADERDTGQGPTGTAIRTGEPQICHDVDDAPEYEPWREQARERGFESSAAIPIVYEDERYGVLNVYTTREHAFDQEEQAVVTQLGEIMGLAIAATEQEADIRERERHYRTLAENVPTGSVVLFDTDLRLQTVAGSIYDDLSIDPEDLRGKRITEIEAFPGDLVQRLEAAYKSALAGEPRNVVVEFEGRTYDVQTIPIRGEDSEVVNGMSLSQDITERREYERTYRSIFENASDGLVVHHFESGEIVDVNRQFCEMNRYDRDELIGETVDVVSPDDDEEYTHERARERIQGAYEEGPQLFEWRNQRSDGTAYPVEVHLSVAEIEGEKRVLASVRDITERKQREEQLRHERERLEFLNRLIRHNLLNDLNTVQARTSLLEPHVDDAAREHFETVQERLDDMIDLIQTLRSLMRFVSDEVDRDLEQVDLGVVLRDSVEHARETYEDAEFEIATDLEDVGSVIADDLLGEVFENLFANAVQHNDQDVPQVTVDVETYEQTATVHVADDGPGVPDDLKERVFAKGEKSFESSGTGFGLYLSQEIVDEYGGTIAVADNEPRGAVFSVTLLKE